MNRTVTILPKVSELIRLHKIWGCAFCALLISCFLSIVLLAQSGEVSLRGQVTDQSGAVVLKVPVTLVAPDGGVREDITDESEGRYVFRDLPAGTYTLRVHVKGFAYI
jgi:hypothetical protein